MATITLQHTFKATDTAAEMRLSCNRVAKQPSDAMAQLFTANHHYHNRHLGTCMAWSYIQRIKTGLMREAALGGFAPTEFREAAIYC